MASRFKCMQGVTLVKVQGRTYRVPSASYRNLPSSGSANNDASNSDGETSTIYTEEIVTLHHPVDKSFHGMLIGKGGSTLKRLKLETGTRIDVTKGRETVMIKGTQDKVDRAVQMIDTLVKEALDRTRPTHFLSLPIQSPEITRRLQSFSNSVLSSTFQCSGMDPSIVVLPENLHLTLGVFKLLSQADIEQAVRFLKEQCPAIVQRHVTNKRLTAHFAGLTIMQSDPKNAHVLYVAPKENPVLEALCIDLRDAMVQAGLMVKEDRPLKLHATLINTSHRKKSPQEKDKPEQQERQPFDARPILKEFGDLDVGVAQLDKLHLMKMGRRGPGGTYLSEGSIPIVPGSGDRA